MENNIEKEFGWDDEIQQESADFILLPEGEYTFKVKSFERARHNGSAKLPPCNKAILTLEIENSQGPVTISHNLFLHSKCEGILSAFFISIGQKKHGEPLKMNWNAVIGASGKCKLEIHSWVSEKSGETLQSNQVKRFLEPDDTAPSKSFVPGKF